MEEQEASGESGVVIEEIVLPPVPEEKAVIDLVVLGERLKHYMLIVFNLLQAKYYQWTPVVRAHASAWGGIFYQQISKQYHMFNLKTRSYKYRTFVAITLLVLILFFVFDALFFASRIDPPKAPMAQKLPPPPPQKNTVPEIAKQQLPWNQQDDAKLNKNLIERTPGLGSKGDQKDTFSADPKNPQSVGKLLSRLVSNDVNLLHYFRSILDKHDTGQRPKRVANKSDGEEEAVFDNDEDEADEEELDTLQRGGKRIVPDSTLTSQQLLLKAWSRQQQEQQQKQQLHEQQQQQPHQQQQPQQANPAEGSGGKPKIVDYENPYLLGDLGAAQMNLPHIRNISDHINELAAFTERLNKEKVPGDNPQLVQLVKDYWIRKPSGLPYQLDQPDLPDTSMGQAAVVDEILRQKRNGFFVECGALDGETRSNTLFFERERGWTGLLIEPGPVNYRRMVKKHRRAYISPACLGVEPHPSRKFFHRGKNRGRLLDAEDSVQWVADQFMILDRTGVQCLPLYTMLLALNQTHVDYFSLDVEGVELEVLQSIPFHLLDIDVISVEFAHGRATKEELKEYATNVLGYRVVYEVSRKDWLANDFILVREDLLN